LGGGSVLKELFRLEGDVAVVTGASGRLGPVWAETLLEAGAMVLGVDRPGQEADDTLEAMLERFGEKRFKRVHADVRNRQALESACTACLDSFGAPSVLVNNAGIDQPPGRQEKGYRLDEIPLEVNLEVFEVNTLGLFLATQVFGAQMVKAGRGSIINIGSLYASVSPDSRLYAHIQSDPPFLKPPAYGASKAAVVNLTKYLATLWAPHGVRVNALSPGGVLGSQDETFKRKFCERVPMGRMAVPTDLRGPLLFLASKASSYVTGVNLAVDGGFTAW
jgi:NAD(P)-dependent dehydrogenase (short-subunit alcohol dehydrogenase family)